MYIAPYRYQPKSYYKMVAASSAWMDSGNTHQISTTVPLSVAVDLYIDTVNNNGVIVANLERTGNWNGQYMAWNGTSTGVLATSVSNNTFVSSGSAPILIGKRQIVGAVWASTTSRQAFCNGVPSTIDTTSNTPTVAPNGWSICGAHHNGTADGFASVGAIFTVAWWNVALTAQDYLAMVAGTPMSAIRPGAIISYSDFQSTIGGLTDAITGFTLTAANTVQTPSLTRPLIISPLIAATASAGFRNRRTLSALGARIGSRQVHRI